MQSIFALAALAPLAYAFTPPTDATFGALLTPDLSSPVTQGETYTVTWDPTGHEKSTVSLVLCRGDSTNCVTDTTAIVEKVPAGGKSYEWDVPCSLPAGKQQTATGYGMLIIEDGTGIFQYSTQFSVLENKACAGSADSSSTTGGGPSKTNTGITLGTPYADPNYNGTAWGGKNGTATATQEASVNTKGPTVIPTQKVTDAPAATGTYSATITWSTATQATATPATQTGVSGAGRNAAGALLLGAIGAAFML